MRRLAPTNRVIFVNPLGTRKVGLQWSMLTIFLQKMKKARAGKHAPTPSSCVVCSPRIIPLVYNSQAMRLNRFLIKRQFTRLLRKHAFYPYILWVGTPTAAFFLDLFSPEMIVYHAVDRYSQFSFVDQPKIRDYEKTVARKADIVLCTSDAIRDDLRAYNPHTATVTHAVDFDHFNGAMRSGDIPDDLKDIPQPIIGYFGGLSERVNLSLLKATALRYPDASLVLIGKQLDDLSQIQGIPNIHILGYRSYDRLPFYLHHFSVCLIPYHVNELMIGVDPIKLREYLCQGKPVVSTKLPEAEKLKPYIYIGESDDDFVERVGDALAESDAAVKAQRIRFAKGCDWSNKMAEISAIVSGAAQRRHRLHSKGIN